MIEWWKLAKSRGVAVRAFKVSLVVGTILVLINQGDKLLAMLAGEYALRGWDVAKMLLTYLVPYLVSTYAAVSALLAGQSGGE